MAGIIRQILYAAVAALWVLPTVAEPSETLKAMQAFQSCVFARAKALSRGSDSATLIATVAVRQCHQQLDAYADVLEQSGFPPAARAKILANEQRIAREYAEEAILDLRSR